MSERGVDGIPGAMPEWFTLERAVMAIVWVLAAPYVGLALWGFTRFLAPSSNRDVTLGRIGSVMFLVLGFGLVSVGRWMIHHPAAPSAKAVLRRGVVQGIVLALWLVGFMTVVDHMTDALPQRLLSACLGGCAAGLWFIAIPCAVLAAPFHLGRSLHPSMAGLFTLRSCLRRLAPLGFLNGLVVPTWFALLPVAMFVERRVRAMRAWIAAVSAGDHPDWRVVREAVQLDSPVARLSDDAAEDGDGLLERCVRAEQGAFRSEGHWEPVAIVPASWLAPGPLR